jgi:hypothetical protein
MLLARKKMRSRKLALSIIVSVVFLFVSEAKGAEAPILAKIKAATTYLFAKNAETFIPNGTGFFVGLKIPSKPGKFELCLVTAKHVLYQPGTTQFVDTIYLRLNKKGGGSELAGIPVKVQGANRTVFIHPDPSVDIAIMPGMPDQKRFDFKFITDEFFLPKEASASLKLYEGFEVFYPSLFFLYAGSGGNYPFFRYGRFALITDEKITRQGKPTALYLIETGTYGEDSGAPVFFFWESGRTTALKLAGVIQGSCGDASPMAGKNKTFSNMGIAGVIPAYKLYEVLFSEELKRKRGF